MKKQKIIFLNFFREWFKEWGREWLRHWISLWFREWFWKRKGNREENVFYSFREWVRK